MKRRTALRLAAYAALLVAVFFTAAWAGGELDPRVDEGSAHEEDREMSTHEKTSEPGADQRQAADPPGAHDAGDTTALPGLAVAASGYRLIPERSELEPGSHARLRFRVVGPDGETVRDFEREHERRMHLIVIRRDFAGFQHLHPRQLDDGSWAIEANLSGAGVYRMFADFATAGESLTLGTDIFVAGRFEPRPLPRPASTADAGAGYEVTLESTAARSGQPTPVRFTVTRDGRALDSIEPYLGADGHLVALREHDQAFLHTHPEGEPGGAGPIAFRVTYPSPGRYRLFVQFKHRGEVHTAAFTQAVGEPAAGSAADHGAAGQESADGSR